jgi:di/tricarboxylate transporter
MILTDVNLLEEHCSDSAEPLIAHRLTPPETEGVKITRSLVGRSILCCAVAGITTIPHLPFGWKAHVILATFVFTIVGLIALPEIAGTVLVICGLGVLGITGAVHDHAFCLSPPVTAAVAHFSDTAAPQKCSGLWWGFSASVTWLVVSAILISAAVASSGFGKRVALILLRSLGRSNLGQYHNIATFGPFTQFWYAYNNSM